MTSTPKMTFAPLAWGRGPLVFEAFLEPTCSFSARAFPKLFELVDRIGGGRIVMKIRLQSQPWHLFSGIVTRAILAASSTPDGSAAARQVMATVFANREAYEFADHCSGPNMDVTPAQLLARLEGQSGIAIAEAFASPDVTREMKAHAKYARQNGIHATPTFMVDGLVRPEIGSGDSIEKWVADLGQDAALPA